jgi:hypothetical protein
VGGRVRPEWLSGRSRLEERLERWAQALNVPFHSLTPDFRAAPDRPGAYHFEFDGHWNAKGHELVSVAITKWLEGVGLLPGTSGRPGRMPHRSRE